MKFNGLYTDFEAFKTSMNGYKADIVIDTDKEYYTWIVDRFANRDLKNDNVSVNKSKVFASWEEYKLKWSKLLMAQKQDILTVTAQESFNKIYSTDNDRTEITQDEFKKYIDGGTSTKITPSVIDAIVRYTSLPNPRDLLFGLFSPLFSGFVEETSRLTSDEVDLENLATLDDLNTAIDQIEMKEGIPGEQGPAGPVGPQGPPGADGSAGTDGQPHEINDKIFAKVKDVYTKPQINSRFEGLFRTEDLLLNRDTISWTSIPSMDKIQTLVSVLNTEAEYFSLTKEGYSSNIVSQPFSLNVNDKVDIYQICNFKETSCVLKDIWSHWRSPADWFDLTEYQQHSVVLQWVNRICGSSYDLSNYIKPDGTTEQLSHIIHIKRSDLGQIYKFLRDEDTDRVTEIQNLADTPEHFSVLNHLTEAEFYTQIGHNTLKVTSTVVNNTSIESFHGWNEQLTDAQIDFFRKNISEYDRAKNNEYQLYDLFNDHEDVMIVAYKNSDGSFVAFNLMRNDNVFTYNSTETIIIGGQHHISTLPEPFNTQRANLNLKYVNSLYTWIEDYNDHIISEPDPDDTIAGYYNQRFKYDVPEASNFPMIPVLTDKQGTIFGVKAYDWGQEHFELKGVSYTKEQIDAQLNNRFSALETEVIDNEMLPYDAVTNPDGLKWNEIPNSNQRTKLLTALGLPSEIWGIGSFLRSPYYAGYYSYIIHYKLFTNESKKYDVFDELNTKQLRVAKLKEILGNNNINEWTSLLRDDVETIVNSRVFFKTEGNETSGYSTPGQLASKMRLSEERFFHLLKIYAKSDQKVKGQEMIENLGNTDIKFTPWKELGNSSLYPTMRERLEALHTPHPWIEVSGSGTTISLFDHSADIPGTAYYASVGEKVGFPIINKYGQELKRFNNNWFFRLYSTGTQQLKDGLYKFDIHIEPPLNTTNVKWNSFFVPEQFQDTTSKTFQYLPISDNINPNGTTIKTYFHSTLKSTSPWQLNANLYNHYFATKTGVNIKGNLKWTKATGDLLYWGEIWWLTNNDVYKHPFFVYYHMRNNVALQSLRWTFDANGSYNNAKPTKFNFSMVRESGH